MVPPSKVNHEQKQHSADIIGYPVQITAIIAFVVMVYIDQNNGLQSNIEAWLYGVMGGAVYGARPETFNRVFRR